MCPYGNASTGSYSLIKTEKLSNQDNVSRSLLYHASNDDKRERRKRVLLI